MRSVIASVLIQVIFSRYYNSFADSGNLDVAKTTAAIVEVAEKTLKAVVKWVTNSSENYIIDHEYVRAIHFHLRDDFISSIFQVSTLYDCFITRKFWDECEMFKRATSEFDRKEKADGECLDSQLIWFHS